MITLYTNSASWSVESQPTTKKCSTALIAARSQTQAAKNP